MYYVPAFSSSFITITYQFYYRYRETRKQIKTSLVDTGQYAEALTSLNAAIAEQSTFYTDALMEQRRDFNFGERNLMIHSLDHLNTIIDNNNPEFMDTDGITKRHDDIVKTELLTTPKQDYNILDPPVE